MAGFIFKLQNIMTSPMTSKYTDVQIAQCLLQNINNVSDNITINELSTICYTSAASLSRFANRLGYKHFNDMKQDYLGIKNEFNDLQIDNAFLNTHMLDSYSKIIAKSIRSIDEFELKNHIDVLCKLIFEYKNVYLFATHIPGEIASIIQRAVLSSGKYIQYISDKHQQIQVAQTFNDNDLCILISMEGTLIMEKDITIPILSSNARSILITHNSNMKFSSAFDYVIPIGNHDPDFTAKYKLLLFADFFINRYFVLVREKNATV